MEFSKFLSICIYIYIATIQNWEMLCFFLIFKMYNFIDKCGATFSVNRVANIFKMFGRTFHKNIGIFILFSAYLLMRGSVDFLRLRETNNSLKILLKWKTEFMKKNIFYYFFLHLSTFFLSLLSPKKLHFFGSKNQEYVVWPLPYWN